MTANSAMPMKTTCPASRTKKFYQMEGYLFPDTYTFYQEMDVELVCQKILENFNDKITKDMYDRMDALNVTLDQTITLASMIQAEAGNTEQMATISSVFWNRLNNATEYPLLQSDPTTKYVEEVIKPHSESYNEDLYTSYDTYQCTGLPAGPICNPGIEAIQAALYPDNTNYYFFYSNIDTKETYFAETIQEHEANQKKVQGQQAAAEESAAAEEKQRGGQRWHRGINRNCWRLPAIWNGSGRRWTTALMPSIWDGKAFSMRAAASNFHSAEQLHEAVALAHQYGKKVYLTCNTLPRNEEIPHVPPVFAGGTGCRRRCAHPGRPGTAGNGTKACAGYGDPYVHTDGHRQLQHLPGAV